MGISRKKGASLCLDVNRTQPQLPVHQPPAMRTGCPRAMDLCAATPVKWGQRAEWGLFSHATRMGTKAQSTWICVRIDHAPKMQEPKRAPTPDNMCCYVSEKKAFCRWCAKQRGELIVSLVWTRKIELAERDPRSSKLQAKLESKARIVWQETKEEAAKPSQ